MAAPLTPYWSTNINIGSKTILIASPATEHHKNIRHVRGKNEILPKNIATNH